MESFKKIKAIINMVTIAINKSDLTFYWYKILQKSDIISFLLIKNSSKISIGILKSYNQLV